MKLKKYGGILLFVLLISVFVGCENPAIEDNYEEENIKTEVKGVAKAVAQGIDFSKLKVKYPKATVKEKTSGIYFSLTEATLYPFTEEGKAYEFSVIQDFGTIVENEVLSVKILAKDGAGELAWVKEDAFDFTVQAEENKDIVLITNEYIPGEKDYWKYPEKAFNDTVTMASVSLTLARSDRLAKYVDWNSAALKKNSISKLSFQKEDSSEIKNHYAAVIAKVPVLKDSKTDAEQPDDAAVTTDDNNKMYWDLLGNDFAIREVVKVSAVGNTANKVYTVKDEVKNIAAFGEKIEVVLSYSINGFPTNSKEVDTTDNKYVSEGTTVKAFRKTPNPEGNDYNGRLLNQMELWNKKIDLYKAEDAKGPIEYFRLNAEKVFYGDEIPEPSVKPTWIRYYYKGMKNPFKSTTTNTVYYDEDTCTYCTLGSIDVEGTNGTAGYAIPVPTVTKYDGKLYFVATRDVHFYEHTEYLSAYE